MNVKIQGSGNGTYANTGSCVAVTNITFSCSIALLIIGITFSATGVFQPKPPINTNAT